MIPDPLDGRGGQFLVEHPPAWFQAAGDAGVVVRPVEAARRSVHRFEQVGPPDQVADLNGLRRVDRALQRAGGDLPDLEADAVLRAFLALELRVGVHEVEVAQHDGRPLEAEDVQHSRPSSSSRRPQPVRTLTPVCGRKPRAERPPPPVAGRDLGAGRPGARGQPVKRSRNIFVIRGNDSGTDPAYAAHVADIFDAYAMAEAWDEMFERPGQPRHAYRSLFAALQPLDPARAAVPGRPAGPGVHRPRGHLRLRRRGAAVPAGPRSPGSSTPWNGT